MKEEKIGMLKINSMYNGKERFWKKCLQVARAQPKLCAEEVEFRTVLLELGLYPVDHEYKR